MGFINRFPYSDFHEMNLDWILKAIKELNAEIQDFEIANKITYQGEWDISKQYPTYSIVVNDDQGYLSIKPVPANIQIDNEEYWVLVINFTAQIADLGERVTELENVTDSLGDRMTDAEGDIAGLGLRMTAAEGDIDSIDSKQKNIIKNSFSDHNFLFIGDSWGAGWNAVEGNVTSPETVIAQDLAPNSYYRYDEGGAGFAYVNGHWFGKLLADFITDHEDIADTITDIFIMGGQNDLNDYATDYDTNNDQYSCKWCSDYINANFPNAKVWIGFLARTANFNTDASYTAINTTIDRYKNAARLYNWNYITHSELMVHDYSMICPNDGKHLLEAGYIKLGHYLAQSIKNGFWDHPNLGYSGLTIMAAADTPGTLLSNNVTDGGITQFIGRSGVTLLSEGFKFIGNTVATITGNAEYVLCKYGSNPAAINPTPANYFSSLYRLRIPITAMITHSNGTATEAVPAVLMLNESGTITIKFLAVNAAGSNWKSFSNCTQVIINAFSFTIPLDLC